MNIKEYIEKLVDLAESRDLDIDKTPFIAVGDKPYTFKAFIDGLKNENAGDITKNIVNKGTEMLNKILLENDKNDR